MRGIRSWVYVGIGCGHGACEMFFFVRAWKFVRENRPAWLSHVAQGQGTWPRSAVRFVSSIRGHMRSAGHM